MTNNLTAAVDAAMVEMADISPPLRRSDCERLIRAAFAADHVAVRQPRAWLHTMFMELDQQRSVPTLNPEHPFGICGKDFSPSYTVQSDALYTAPPAPALPDNLESHRNTWIQAMERLVELEPESCAPDEDEKGFWRHELQAMRDMYTDLDKLQAKPPCP